MAGKNVRLCGETETHKWAEEEAEELEGPITQVRKRCDTLANVRLRNQTISLPYGEFDSHQEIDDLIHTAADDYRIESVEFVFKDDKMVHLCITPTCPYCQMTFHDRSFLADHIAGYRDRGTCMSS